MICFSPLRFGAFAVRQRLCLRICSHRTELCGRGLIVGPAFSRGLVPIVTDDDHSSTDKVDDGQDGEVNEVHQELKERERS